MTDDYRRKVERLGPWAAGLLLASPVLIAYYPPMTDLPHHEAAIGLLRHFGDPSFLPPGLYQLNLGQPNQLVHMVGWALSQVVSTRWAVKLIVAAAVVAVPVCAARFARHVVASPLAALVVAPLALSFLFSLGLVANLVGLAALLAALPALDDLERRPTVRGALQCAGAVVLLYFAHEAMLFVFAATALALALVHPWSSRLTPLRLVPFVAGALVAAVQAEWQKRYVMSALLEYPPQYDPLSHKLEILPSLLVQSTEGPVIAAMTGLSLLAIVSFLLLRTRERAGAAPAASPAAPTLDRLRARALAYRWEIFSVVCLAAYLAFPFTLNGATYVYQRWLPPGLAVLAVVAAPRDLWSRSARIARLAVLTLPPATLLIAIPAFADSGREYEALERIIPLVQPSSSVAGIDLGPIDATRTYWLGAAPGRILATRGGRLAFGFTYSTVSPVLLANAYAWPDTVVRLGADPWSFSPPYDLRRFRYVLVRASDANLARAAVRSLRPESRYVATAGEWMLFESRLPLVPPLTGDASTEDLGRDTVRKRILTQLPLELDARSPGVSDSRWPDPRDE